MKKSVYPCSQPTLYQTCMLIAANCKAKMAAFALFSAAYSLTFIDAVVAAIEQAEQMPAEEARALQHEQIRQQMIPLNKDCLKRWQYLKRYIAKMYPNQPELWEMNWNAAGWQHYDSNNAWVKTQALMNMGSQYIALHSVALLANSNMPAGFEAAFNAAADAFNLKYASFLAEEILSVEGTDAKIDANNAVYESIVAICLDGQAIFEGDDTLTGEFSFEKMSNLVSPAGASAVQFNVSNSETEAPMAGVDISMTGSDKSTLTDAEGHAELNQLPAGDQQFKLTADGFKEETIALTLTGTTKTADTVMNPLFQGEMTVGSNGVSVPENA